MTVESMFNYNTGKQLNGCSTIENRYQIEERNMSAKKEKEVLCCVNGEEHGELLGQVSESMPNEIMVKALADFFKMFGDPTRAKILWALDQSELCVCDLGTILGMTKSAVSHQLSTLRKANLVKFRREGKNVYYSLKDDHVKSILEVGMEHIQE